MEQLKKEQETELRKILKTEGFKILLLVIQARGQEASAKAVELSLEAAAFNAKGEAADAALKTARDCHVAHKLLEEIAGTETHSIARLT